MTVISESQVRMHHLKNNGEKLMLPPDAVVTPAAADYARGHGISLVRQEAGGQNKAQHMTHGRGGLIPKNEPLIRFRGSLDTLQAIIALIQCKAENAGRVKLVRKLEELMLLIRNVMRAEVLDEPLECEGIWGESWSRCHEVSHAPELNFGVSHTPVSHSMGETAVWLNYLRTQVRETEIAAVDVFCSDGALLREDIVTVLNRLSSAVHVLYLKEISGRAERDD